MKKKVALFLALCLLFSSLAMSACGNEMMTFAPTEAMTDAPTEWQTGAETSAQTDAPTAFGTDEAVTLPTQTETEMPTEAQTVAPTEEKTEALTDRPTEVLTEEVTEAPTEKPSIIPPWVNLPTEKATETSTVAPTEAPTEKPGIIPPWVGLPTEKVTKAPTVAPTEKATEAPTAAQKPTQSPSEDPTKVTSEGIYVREDDYIYFGEYPQSVKSGDVTITNQKDSRGYYLGSDGAYYAKRDSDPYNPNHKFSNGQEISYDIYYFKVEPIRWMILDEADGTYFLLCDTVLEGQRFDWDENNYAESDIRAWLNGTFYQQAFSSSQQENILVTTVDNSAASTAYDKNPNACIDTNDKIFLLSYDEIVSGNYGRYGYFASGISSYDRSIVGSDYAIARWIYAGSHSTCNWWMRSPNNTGESYVGFVNFRGETGETYSDNVLVGVAPALKMKVLDEPTEEPTERPTEEPTEEPTNPTLAPFESPTVPQDEAYLREGDYIWFGEYPQTLKEDGISVTSTKDSRGYYLGSDGAYYAKVVAIPFEEGYYFSNGATIENGVTYYFKVEPIRWRVIEETNGAAWLLCDSIIGGQLYDSSENLRYDDSDIRAWLNQTFYQTAFNDLQRELILTTTVDNSVESTGYSANQNVCADTEDKIFLLSSKEVKERFDAAARRKLASDYVRALRVPMDSTSDYNHFGTWITRSPFKGGYYVNAVSCFGDFSSLLQAVGEIAGIVPTLWISLE